MHLAVQAARLAHVPLVLAGSVYPYPEHERYFREVVAPACDGNTVRFVGPVGLARKRRLLALARCLVVPSLASETSSLVAMEALACGTPVVAFRAGALATIVEHGRTGFIVDSVEDMAEALANVGTIDPATCRRAAEERFAAQRMAAQYLVLYSRLAARPQAQPARRRAAPGFEIEEVTRVSGLDAVRDEWTDLWARCPWASVFQHPDWLIPWCAAFDVHEPWALFVRQRGQLVGMAPLLVYRRGAERVLTLMGGGVSDDQDVLLDPRVAAAALGEVFAYVVAQHAEWDVCEFENLCAQSPLVQAYIRLGSAAPGLVQHDTRVALALPGCRDDLELVVPHGLLKQVRYLQRRAERDGLRPAVEEASPATLAVTFDALVRLHRRRWAERGQSGMLTGRLEAFHREVARHLLQRGLLRLYTLELGGHVAAGFYGFSVKNRSAYYLGGFDPAFSRYSPGTLVVAHAIDRAVADDHAHTFDFLRGREAYKLAWGGTEQPLYRWSMRSPVQSGNA
jgi:CelD/BcsL family acetyltransferase involved in cellulose biosynthesis